MVHPLQLRQGLPQIRSVHIVVQQQYRPEAGRVLLPAPKAAEDKGPELRPVPADNLQGAAEAVADRPVVNPWQEPAYQPPGLPQKLLLVSRPARPACPPFHVIQPVADDHPLEHHLLEAVLPGPGKPLLPPVRGDAPGDFSQQGKSDPQEPLRRQLRYQGAGEPQIGGLPQALQILPHCLPAFQAAGRQADRCFCGRCFRFTSRHTGSPFQSLYPF